MDNIVLLSGAHATREQGMCVMEAVAFFAGEEHSDAPHCACPVIARFAQGLNDRLDDEHRQRLKPMIPTLALSRISPEVEQKRMFLAADFAVRRWAPVALEALNMKEQAAALRASAPIVDKASALKGKAAAAANAAYAAAAAAAANAAADAAIRRLRSATTDAAAADAAYYAAAAAANAAADAVYVYAADSQDWLVAEGIACLEAMLAITA